MWSRIASLVDDLNFEDDEEYSDSNSVSEQKGPSLLNSELESTKEELAKYYVMIGCSKGIKKR